MQYRLFLLSNFRICEFFLFLFRWFIFPLFKICSCLRYPFYPFFCVSLDVKSGVFSLDVFFFLFFLWCHQRYKINILFLIYIFDDDFFHSLFFFLLKSNLILRFLILTCWGVDEVPVSSCFSTWCFCFFVFSFNARFLVITLRLFFIWLHPVLIY